MFKQARFIEAAIANVEEALRDGAIMVAVILFLFLLNFRTTAITLVTIPLSLLVTAIVFKLMGLSIDTMTLGGLAVAIGELVDDAIVDVENVFRRLRENRAKGSPKSALKVVYDASSEVRNSIVFSTIIVVLVFIPLFALGGIEGRLFAPLGVAYIISLTASLVVSLTVTPVLCSYLLLNAKATAHDDSWLVRRLKDGDRHLLARTIRRPYAVLGGCAALLLGALCLLPLMGRNFLPAFNEGTATIGVAAAPGIALADSDAPGIKIEEAMPRSPRSSPRSAVRAAPRWTSMPRACIGAKSTWTSRRGPAAPRRPSGASREGGEDGRRLRQHRPAHQPPARSPAIRRACADRDQGLGPELSQLRLLGAQIESAMKRHPGVVDLQLEPSSSSQLKLAIDLRRRPALRSAPAPPPRTWRWRSTAPRWAPCSRISASTTSSCAWTTARAPRRSRSQACS